MIPLSKTLSPFSLCLIGLWSNNGKPVILLVEDLPIRKALILQAFLLRIREGMIYTTQLRRFLLKHPLLVIELDFHLEEDPTAPYGFDVEKTLPSDFWLREKLRGFDRALLQALLQALIITHNFGMLSEREESEGGATWKLSHPNGVSRARSFERQAPHHWGHARKPPSLATKRVASCKEGGRVGSTFVL
jgi:hypothetical protein